MGKEKLDGIISEENNKHEKEVRKPICGRSVGPTNTGNEEIERIRKLYEMSVFLQRNCYNVDRIGHRRTEIKTGIKDTIKTGIYKIILTYVPSDPEFHTVPQFDIDVLDLYSTSRRNFKRVLILSLYSFDPRYLKHGLTTDITEYEPGKWEEVLEKKYEEKLEEDRWRTFPINYKGKALYKDVYPDFYVLEGDKDSKS